MNEELELKSEYKETFAEIHAPVALAGKVKNMHKNHKANETKQSTMLKKLAMAAAVFVVLLVGSNGVVYAATGSTWLRTVIVNMNGKQYSVDMTGEQTEDGLVTYSGYLEGEDGPVTFMVTDDAENTDGMLTDIYIVTSSPEILEEDDKIYLVNADIKIDITEDAADGKASGSYEIDKVIYHYEIELQNDEWSIRITESVNK